MSFLFQLTVLDWFFLAILIGSIVASILKGFARETISLGALIIGLVLAAWFYPVPGSFFMNFVKTHDIASLLGFLSIFLGCVLLGGLISWITNKLIKISNLEWFDRLLGAIFGLIRGWILGSVIFLVLTAFPVKLESVQDAKFAPYLLAGARVLAVVMPSELKAKFLEGYRKVENIWVGIENKNSGTDAKSPKKP